jgi:DNA-binding transcriptional regulator GbsR (MarR family)
LELVEQLLIKWGYAHSEAKVYATLLLEGRPLTISDIAKRTGLSRSSVSVSLNRLAEDYMVVVSKKGRTKMFKAQPAFLQSFLKQPRELLERKIIPLEEIVSEMLKRGEGFKHMQRVLEDIRTLKYMLQKILEIEKGLERSTIKSIH